jgi:uncharacterized protein YkwD
MKSGFFTSSLVALSFVAFPAFAKGNSNNLSVKKNTSVQVQAEVAFDAAAEIAIVKIVNEERAAVGLPPLSIDPRLREAAREHSRDMGEIGFFDHTSPVKGKAKFTDRIKGQGLAKFGTAGENIAMIGGNKNRAEQFMNMWMNSSGHRANILGEDYNYIGVGVYVTANGEVYATQEFSSLGDTKASPKNPISLPEIEIEAPQMTGPQVAPPQSAPEDIFGGTDEEEIFDNGPQMAPQPAPQPKESTQAKKDKIKGILNSRSGDAEAVYPEYAPSNGSYDDVAARKAKILSILEERSDYDNSQEGVVIIVVPSRQPTYQQPTYQQPQYNYNRSYYTPKQKNGCN